MVRLLYRAEIERVSETVTSQLTRGIYPLQLKVVGQKIEMSVELVASKLISLEPIKRQTMTPLPVSSREPLFAPLPVGSLEVEAANSGRAVEVDLLN